MKIGYVATGLFFVCGMACGGTDPVGLATSSNSSGPGAGGGTSGSGGASSSGGSTPGCSDLEAGGFTFERIAHWKDDAKAAYSMIHDDMCGPALQGIHEIAVPLLAKYGLAAGLAPFVEACQDANLFDVLKDAESKGNEIISHSYTHPNIDAANQAKEVVQAKVDFDKQLTHPVSFYVFPYDFYTDQTIGFVKDAGHLGCRCGNRDDYNGSDKPPVNVDETDFKLTFDVWPRTYSKYALYTENDMLAVHVHNAIEKNGWAIREFHSVIKDGSNPDNQGFGPITESDYEKHLDFLARAWDKGVVWTAPPSTVLRYRHARTACKATLDGDTIKFDTSSKECTDYATAISVIVSTGNDINAVSAEQSGNAVESRKLGPKEFSISADPTKGDVKLSCADNGSSLNPQAVLDPKPSPANSVCDLETVVGTGSPGLMDDLERPVAEFQLLPNPSQGDGRTGSWSWYPGNVTVEMFSESNNTVVRYAATNLNAWTGVTLAFLGGNGAGSCYDATAYSGGIRFKIKGSVVSNDALNGKVIMSIVTAETQSKTFGGDLEGAGGHFHKQVTLTANWQTVQVGWSQLSKPTWGDTVNLASVAKKKLQAIDWGVTNMASSFEIYIDDIELY